VSQVKVELISTSALPAAACPRRDGARLAELSSEGTGMRQPWVVRTITALLMATALAGCKSGSSSPSATTPAAGNGTATAAATCVVPQNNGGDHDADNNGGPDDGDGCDK
jgi:hypothetical protein